MDSSEGLYPNNLKKGQDKDKTMEMKRRHYLNNVAIATRQKLRFWQVSTWKKKLHGNHLCIIHSSWNLNINKITKLKEIKMLNSSECHFVTHWLQLNLYAYIFFAQLKKKIENLGYILESYLVHHSIFVTVWKIISHLYLWNDCLKPLAFFSCSYV